MQIWQWVVWIFGEQSIRVMHQKPTRLELQYRNRTITFDRERNLITRNGQDVAAVTSVNFVELHEPSAHTKGVPNWEISVLLHDARKIAVGQVRHSTDASIVCAHIATVTGKSVKVTQS